MQLDQLQIDLRPRTNAQALDLGFALLRSNAKACYLVWLILWVSLVSISIGMTYLLDISIAWSMGMAWWLRPFLERAPLYVLSRQVFGESVTWQEALRAWPRQLGGGWFRLLTWWRPFSSGRGLIQPIWQLENARGKKATLRSRVISKNTMKSAVWFGIACAHFEGIIEIGVLAGASLFFSGDSFANPFALFMHTENEMLINVCTTLSYATAVALIGPIYVACSFCLYLNRRASLEAWDIELMLKQMQKQTVQSQNRHTTKQVLVSLLSGCLIVFAAGLFPISDTFAANETKPAVSATSTPECSDTTPYFEEKELHHQATQNSQHAAIRSQVDALYESKELAQYACIKSWQLKENLFTPNLPKPSETKTRNLDALALAFKYGFIFLAIVAVGMLLFRYRDQFASLQLRRNSFRAKEVAGLDIRPESLPDDVAASALGLWQRKEFRAALALLYRASLSHLVLENHLVIHVGATMRPLPCL